MSTNLKKRKKSMWKPTVKAKFIDNKEIAVFVIIFFLIAYILFPKGKIERFILEEDSNINLSNIYLKQLIKLNPDPNLKILMVERLIKLGKYDEVLDYIKELELYPEENIKAKAFFSKYLILKTKYFSDQFSEEDKEKIRQEMKEILKSSYRKSLDLNFLEEIFKESLSMAFPDIALEVSLKINSIKPENLHWLEESYKQSLATENYSIALNILRKLIMKDEKDKVFWLQKFYNISLMLKDYDEALWSLNYLKVLDKNNEVSYNKKILDLYLIRRDYIKAMDYCLFLLEKERNFNKKKEYFKKTLEIAMYSKNYRLVKETIRKNYKNFLQDREMVKFILKSALATGDPKFAHEIALEIKNEVLK